MIEVENLTKNYGPFQALKGISFRIDKGEVIGFLGAKWCWQNHHHADFDLLYAR